MGSAEVPWDRLRGKGVGLCQESVPWLFCALLVASRSGLFPLPGGGLGQARGRESCFFQACYSHTCPADVDGALLSVRQEVGLLP